MNLRIGIDIDGVVTSPYSWLEGFNKLYNKNLKREDCTNYNLQKLFGVSDEEWESNKAEHMRIFHEQYKIRESNRTWLKELSNYAELYFITARENNYSCYRSIKNILSEMGITFTNKQFGKQVIFSKNKVKSCKELDINFMVEDSPQEATSLSENGIQVILLYAEYNKFFKYQGANPNASSNIRKLLTCDDVVCFIEKISERIKRIENTLDDMWGNCPKALGLKNYCGESESCYECWCKTTGRSNMS